MGSGGSSSKGRVEYAGYIEDAHQDFADKLITYTDEIASQSPYVNYADISLTSGFFGTGYLLSTYPSLYDIYGKFIAGLDINALYSQLYEDTINSSETATMLDAESSRINVDIATNLLPRFQDGKSDILSKMSETFVTGKTIISNAKNLSQAKFSGQIKTTLIATATERWQIHLGWNKNVVKVYAAIMKLYFSAKIDVDETNFSFATKDKLWPFTVLEYERAALGALQGGFAMPGVEGASQAQKSVTGTMTGAAAGAMIGAKYGSVGGPWGAVIGGVVGLAASFL